MNARLAAGLAITILALACGGEKAAPPPPPAAGGGTGDGELTPFQVEHGIGPVTEVVTLGEIDGPLVAKGKETFEVKCTACHKVGERYVGPALNDVLSRRSPTYVMNMILNPNEMVERHPAAKQVLAEYMTLMANQGLTVEEARAVLEYLRTEQTKADAAK